LAHFDCNVFNNSNINENEISPNNGGLKHKNKTKMLW